MVTKQETIDLDFIGNCSRKKSLRENEWLRIAALSGSNSYDIRYAVSELLALFPCSDSENILLSLLHDDDAMIRASACDSLSFSRSAQTRDRLAEQLKDRNKLVRGYAALSIGDIQRNLDDTERTVDILQSSYRKERSKWCRLAIARSLLLLGDASYTDDLLNAVNDRSYQIRGFALKLMIDLINDYGLKTDPSATVAVLSERREKETAVSVKNNIIQLLALYDGSKITDNTDS